MLSNYLNKFINYSQTSQNDQIDLSLMEKTVLNSLYVCFKCGSFAEKNMEININENFQIKVKKLDHFTPQKDISSDDLINYHFIYKVDEI